MDAAAEDFMPVLSAGRHRNARRGACFMEYASFLAGQRWSDHPLCTHPSLAALARLVNDLTSDSTRSRLSVHVTSVIGVVGDDPRVPVILSALAAASALPVANQSRQRALATALIRCDRLLSAWEGPEIDRARMRIRVAFLMAPGTEAWARSFVGEAALATMPLVSVNEEAILRTSVIGIADACVEDADVRLERLLIQAIEECTAILMPASQDETATAVRQLQPA
jgi:hypothetical protein